MKRQNSHLFSILCLGLLLTACGQSEHVTNTATSTPSTSTQPSKATQELAKPSSALTNVAAIKAVNSSIGFPEQSELLLDCDQSSQCKAIGLEPSACGGYSYFWPYSTKTTKNKSLIKQIEKANQLKKLAIKKNGQVGICVHINKPAVRCVANLCGSAEQKALY